MNATTSTSKKKAVTKKKAVAKKAVATKKKVATKSPVVKKKVTAKKRVVSKKSVPAKKRAVPSVSNKDRYEMISTMAYFRSEKRSFEPGRAVDDWLECERLVDEMISKA